MDEANVKSERSADLRRRAEEILQGKTELLKELSAQDIQSIIHELRVHQIELEMQNEELRRAQREIEESRNRYSDLYDFAPVGYFTFDANGTIIAVNLTGARKLGVERRSLIRVPFSLYVAPGSRDTFYLHLRQVFRAGSRQTCELKIVDKSRNQFDARLESLAVQDGEGKINQCRTAVIDITELKRAEEALRRAHDELDMRVRERTVELAHANEALKAEITERERAWELSKALNDINLTINSTLDFDEIMRRIVVEAGKAIGSDACNITLHKEGRWIIEYAYGLSQQVIGVSFTGEDAAVSEHVAQTKKPLVIRDIYTDDRSSRWVMKKYGIYSVLAIPLMVRGDAIGILYFDYFSVKPAFSKIEIDFTEKLSYSISLALENARLYSSLQQELSRMRDKNKKDVDESDKR
ncbi:PAS domain S-box [Candidatus Methanoperedens nitroreducens]|uniref:PAS domain S-box n=1 Tax=Candidatus Methanoperedens nitratireducens TaxID=1392998 RepID=A0A062V259_9EURY|nr:GAF domain-containing protein [Candidatus Methanoperedens nitroreducens]KCZ73201.1 PAS domain S-box [Candidatus Methanoperedens nitroreducens]MDJ1422850.1 GAF domain-containing protein [Candidatus Methanoperedens sp.]